MRIMWEAGGEEHHLRLDEGQTLIGRSRACAVYYPHRSLSRQHAALERSGERLFVHDLGSRLGVKVNGRRVKAAELEEGDAVTVGWLVLHVRGLPPREDPLEGSGFQAEPESDVLAPALVPAPAQAMRLRIEQGAAPRALPLGARERWLLGSDAEADFVLAAPAVSARHAELIRQPDGWTLRDLGSRHGTLVDGAQVIARRLSGGELLELGAVRLRFEPVPTPSLLDSVVDRFRPRSRARQVQLALAGLAMLLPAAAWAGSSRAIAAVEGGVEPRLEQGLIALRARDHRAAAEAFGSAARAARETADPRDEARAEALRAVAVHWQGLEQGGPLQFYWGKAADLIERAARQEGLSPAAAAWIESERRFVALNAAAWEALSEGGRALAAHDATRELTARLSIAETGERAFARIGPGSLLAVEAAVQRRELRRRALKALETELDLRAAGHRPDWRELLALIGRGERLALEDGAARARLLARAARCELALREEGLRRAAGAEGRALLSEALAAWAEGDEARARVRLEAVLDLGEGVPADVRVRAGETRQRWRQVESGLALAREHIARGMHAEAEGELRRVALLEPDPRSRCRIEAEEALRLLARQGQAR